jgi:hypothetical protein
MRSVRTYLAFLVERAPELAVVAPAAGVRLPVHDGGGGEPVVEALDQHAGPRGHHGGEARLDEQPGAGAREVALEASQVSRLLREV